MRWNVHGERPIYESEWVSLSMVDVELPDGRRFEHHVVKGGRAAAGAVVHHPDRGLLLLWRHRFITDAWGWEIPAGMVDEGETPEQAALREVEEESGWRVTGPLTPLCSFAPMSGIFDRTFHLFGATDATLIGDPTDVNESDRVEWVPVADAAELVRRGDVHDGFGLVAVLWALSLGV
jgi:8-oxo-dGTP pyrophosphatase MutT (NUDIX family)